MKTIQIKKSALKSELIKSLHHANSTEWDIYVDMDGELDTRHNTHSTDGWFEIIDLYDAALENDGVYPGDDGYDYNFAADWIVDELGGWLPEYVENWTIDGLEQIPVELID